MRFDNFKKYITEKGSKERNEKHTFYKIETSLMEEIDKAFKIPFELKLFYTTIGHGYMYDTKENYSIDKFLDPLEFKKINLREDYYEFDPTLDFFNDSEYVDKLIFFEVNEGVYLLIDKEAKNGKNAIYYFDKKIANSLEEFLIKFDKEGHYFESD